MSRFIFLTATNNGIAVQIEDTWVGKSNNSTELVDLLIKQEVKPEDLSLIHI